MNALLLAVILLFFILCIRFKEGYYSDSYTNATSNSMTTFVGKLNTLKSTLTQLTTQDLNLDAQSKINPLLNPPTEKLYGLGIVEHAHSISKRISIYQDRLLLLKNTIKNAADLPVHFKEGDVPLSVAIDSLIDEADDILTQLNQIPDS